MTIEEIISAVEKAEGIGGMTVNERLWATELMDEFEKTRKFDKDKARTILELLQVDKPSIELIINKII